MELDEQYWAERYKNRQTQWDAGSITTPLKEYFDQLENKNLKILIPGCGNAYEAAYLHERGFPNVYLVDITALPLLNFKNTFPDFPENQIIHADFFDLKDQFDLIIEQTFFSALDPSLRDAYAEKVYELLKPGGKLVGVLFDDPLNTDRPPFGGHPQDYERHFKELFVFKKWQRCFNSIKPRQGREWFMILEKPKI